jgi:hypothetical protein
MTDPFAELPRGHYGAILADPSRALEIGKAAEHLVCADLMLAGYRVFLSDQGLPYDLLVDLGNKFIRVQVKATGKLKNANAKGRSPNMVYVFHARRRGKNGKGAHLGSQDCDVIALVALDTRTIAYMPINKVAQTVSLYPSGYTFPGKFKRSRYAAIDGFPFKEAIGAN